MNHYMFPASMGRKQFLEFIDMNRHNTPVLLSLSYKKNVGDAYSAHVYLMLLSYDCALLVIKKPQATRAKSYLAWKGSFDDIRKALYFSNGRTTHAISTLIAFLESQSLFENQGFGGLVSAFSKLGVENIYDILQSSEAKVMAYGF